ncbi:MAG TPA: hypothetical protein VF101_11445 [Gaiellaceae bacterium]
MIYVIMGSHVRRNEAGSNWKRNGVAFTAASIVSGATAGAALGAIGGHLADGRRSTLVVLLAALGVVLGLLESIGKTPRLPQRSCETPQSLMRGGALRAAIRNGSILGVGATSRLGFWLWYVVPLGSLLTGSTLGGACVYGVYATARGLGPWMLIPTMRLLARRVATGFEGGSLWLLGQNALARRVAGFQLVLLGLMGVIGFGR